jgi:hypothetical protein
MRLSGMEFNPRLIFGTQPQPAGPTDTLPDGTKKKLPRRALRFQTRSAQYKKPGSETRFSWTSRARRALSQRHANRPYLEPNAPDLLRLAALSDRRMPPLRVLIWERAVQPEKRPALWGRLLWEALEPASRPRPGSQADDQRHFGRQIS